jgi:hypothetical protein
LYVSKLLGTNILELTALFIELEVCMIIYWIRIEDLPKNLKKLAPYSVALPSFYTMELQIPGIFTIEPARL